MEDENKQTIYTLVVIYLDSDKTYRVYNTESRCTIGTGIKTPDEALAIKKAYCDGYYDGTADAKKEMN